MLSRTISRDRSRHPLRSWQALGVALVATILGSVGYLVWPKSLSRIRPTPITEDELRSTILSLRAPDYSPPTPMERKRADLGRLLFAEKRLSGSGEISCASCHRPDRAFTDGEATPQIPAGPDGISPAASPVNTPSVVNAHLLRWTFWDGRSDSLTAQALSSLEDPQFMGTSRIAVVSFIAREYREEYEEAYGPLPNGDFFRSLPEHGRPIAKRPALPTETAAYALATLHGKGRLLDLLNQAQKNREAPAAELSRQALSHPSPPLPWAWTHGNLDPETEALVDQIFLKVGRALATYEKMLVTAPSLFDQFAARVASGDSIETAAQVTGLSPNALSGLKLFAGPGACLTCHNGPLLSDQSFHNIGLPRRSPHLALGRATGRMRALADDFNCLGARLPESTLPSLDSTGLCDHLASLVLTDFAAVGAYKTPSLRNAAVTAPYMHDGRFQTLREVLQHYSAPHEKPAIGQRDPLVSAKNFTPEEIAALESFIKTLSSATIDLGNPGSLSQLTP